MISIKGLKKKIWVVFSKYIRKRDKYTCFTCGKKEKPGHAGHYIHNKLDFDPLNVHHQCIYCNRYLRGNLGVYGEKLIRENGIEKIEEMRVRSKQIWKPSRQELEDILNYWIQRDSQG